MSRSKHAKKQPKAQAGAGSSGAASKGKSKYGKTPPAKKPQSAKKASSKKKKGKPGKSEKDAVVSSTARAASSEKTTPVIPVLRVSRRSLAVVEQLFGGNRRGGPINLQNVLRVLDEVGFAIEDRCGSSITCHPPRDGSVVGGMSFTIHAPHTFKVEYGLQSAWGDALHMNYQWTLETFELR